VTSKKASEVLLCANEMSLFGQNVLKVLHRKAKGNKKLKEIRVELSSSPPNGGITFTSTRSHEKSNIYHPSYWSNIDAIPRSSKPMGEDIMFLQELGNNHREPTSDGKLYKDTDWI
jgi:hypothetical protein